MKNKYKILMLGLIATAGLTACNKDNGKLAQGVEQNEKKDNEDVGKDDKFQVAAKAEDIYDYIKKRGEGSDIKFEDFEHIPHNKIDTDDYGDTYKFDIEGGLFVIRVNDDGKITRFRIRVDSTQDDWDVRDDAFPIFKDGKKVDESEKNKN